MTSQYLDVTSSSVSPERLFSSVVLVKIDSWGSLLDTTFIDVRWAKHPTKLNLKQKPGQFTITHSHPDIHKLSWLTPIMTYVTDTHQYMSLTHTNHGTQRCLYTSSISFLAELADYHLNQLLMSTFCWKRWRALSVENVFLDKQFLLKTTYSINTTWLTPELIRS